jgi:broad specificity phosphatase PhoE
VSPRATLILVRHAHADCTRNGQALLCGRYDSALSPLGCQQVSALRHRLRNEHGISAVYTSPLRRAMGTAAATPNQFQPRVLSSLAEIDCGCIDGLPLNRVEAEYSDLWRRNCAQDDPSFRWPGGESYPASGDAFCELPAVSGINTKVAVRSCSLTLAWLLR